MSLPFPIRMCIGHIKGRGVFYCFEALAAYSGIKKEKAGDTNEVPLPP